MFLSPGDLSNPGIEPRSPQLQADSLPAEPPRKPKNTAVGSLTLLQHIFPTQESIQGLLHYKQILYEPSYQGSLRPSRTEQRSTKVQASSDWGIKDTVSIFCMFPLCKVEI